MLELKDYSVNPILEGINIEFDVGRTYIVMGANGVGKSTLLHSIMAVSYTHLTLPTILLV